MQTDRTAFLCLQRYQQTLNDYATDTWSKEKADLLYKHVTLNLGKEDIISWDKGLYPDTLSSLQFWGWHM